MQRKSLCYAPVIAAVAAAAVWFWPESKAREASEGEGVLVSRRIRESATGKAASSMAVRVPPLRRQDRLADELKEKAQTEADREFAAFMSREEEEELTEAAREIFRELQRAVAKRDFKSLQRLLERIMRDPSGTLGMASVPRAIRMRLVQALGGFGAEGIPELMEFLADEDPEIVQTAQSVFSSGIHDLTLSDSERSAYVLAGAKTFHDEQSLTLMLSSIYNMRHSVGVETITRIMAEGTDEAKVAVENAVRFFTQDANVKTADDLRNWLEAHPDGEADDILYGGFRRL